MIGMLCEPAEFAVRARFCDWCCKGLWFTVRVKGLGLGFW